MLSHWGTSAKLGCLWQLLGCFLASCRYSWCGLFNAAIQASNLESRAMKGRKTMGLTWTIPNFLWTSTRDKSLDQKISMNRLLKCMKTPPFTITDSVARAIYRGSQKHRIVRHAITVSWAMIIIAHCWTIVLESDELYYFSIYDIMEDGIGAGYGEFRLNAGVSVIYVQECFSNTFIDLVQIKNQNK